MKKNLVCFFLVGVFFMPVAVNAIPMHNISLNLGLSMPGETEIATYYNHSGVSDSIRAYNLGVSYDFAPVEFITIGAGVNFALRSFIMEYPQSAPAYEDNVNFNAVEPFVQLKAYLQVMEGVDLFAGAGAGYAVLIGSSIVNGEFSTTTPINGGAMTYKFGGGAAYNQGMFTAIMDVGYKIASINPSPAVLNPNVPNNEMIVNLGGVYVTIGGAISLGSHAQARNEGEIKKELDKEISGLDTSSDDADTDEMIEPAEEEPVLQQKNGAAAPAKRAKEESWIESVAIEKITEPAATATEEPVKTEPVKEETTVSVKADEPVQVEDAAVDTDGIIIISPGESEMSELEKYITKKNKQFKPYEEEQEGEQDSGEDLMFDYDEKDSGIIVVEAENKGTVDRAGYVLVEKAGFISNNFAEDGFIYSLDEYKELLSAGDFAYIKLTAGIGAPKGKQFTIFEDDEDIINKATGESMGKLVKFLGVAKVTGSIEDNIFKVQIIKSYEPIRNNYKIKARNDLKKYHKEINMKVKKKNMEVRAHIVKVKDDFINLKSKDLVYLDAGLSKGLLPGVKMGIFRETEDKVSGKLSEYDNIGTLIIINSMQTTSVGLIVSSRGMIKVGDIVKTSGK